MPELEMSAGPAGRPDGKGHGLAPGIIRHATYLGGHPMLGQQPISGLRLVVDDGGWTGTCSTGVDSLGREERETRFTLPWGTVDRVSLDVGGRDDVAFRFAAAGLIGLLTAKRRVSLVLGTAQGDALFELHERRPQRIRAQLSPWIAAHTGTGPAAPSGH